MQSGHQSATKLLSEAAFKKFTIWNKSKINCVKEGRKSRDLRELARVLLLDELKDQQAKKTKCPSFRGIRVTNVGRIAMHEKRLSGMMRTECFRKRKKMFQTSANMRNIPLRAVEIVQARVISNSVECFAWMRNLFSVALSLLKTRFLLQSCFNKTSTLVGPKVWLKDIKQDHLAALINNEWEETKLTNWPTSRRITGLSTVISLAIPLNL